jgi:integrase
LFERWAQPQVQLNAAADRAGVVPRGFREDAGPLRAHRGGTTPTRARPWSISTNVLRASYCTELVLKGVHTRKIAELMGHTNTRTAERWYARLRGADLSDVAALVADPAGAP